MTISFKLSSGIIPNPLMRSNLNNPKNLMKYCESKDSTNAMIRKANSYFLFSLLLLSNNSFKVE